MISMKNKKVDEYITKQASPQKEICSQLRSLIFSALPSVMEEMKWGVPSYDGGKFYIVSLETHVNMGFSIENLPKKEIGLLQGSGKTMKVIEVASETDIDEDRIIKLLKLVYKT